MHHCYCSISNFYSTELWTPQQLLLSPTHNFLGNTQLDLHYFNRKKCISTACNVVWNESYSLCRGWGIKFSHRGISTWNAETSWRVHFCGTYPLCKVEPDLLSVGVIECPKCLVFFLVYVSLNSLDKLLHCGCRNFYPASGFSRFYMDSTECKLIQSVPAQVLFSYICAVFAYKNYHTTATYLEKAAQGKLNLVLSLSINL